MTAAPLLAGDSFEQPPISDSASQPANAIEELNDRLGSGAVRLVFEHSLGYLRSVLDLLHVPMSSQTLVFSKTSLQQRHISPRSPRAIYFNDDVYVGFVHGGDMLEMSVADPQLGTVFYTLDQVSRERPTFVRQTNDCLMCHGGSQTRGVPGNIVLSVYADQSGQPIFSAGSHRVGDVARRLFPLFQGAGLHGAHGGYDDVRRGIRKAGADRWSGTITAEFRPQDPIVSAPVQFPDLLEVIRFPTGRAAAAVLGEDEGCAARERYERQIRASFPSRAVCDLRYSRCDETRGRTRLGPPGTAAVERCRGMLPGSQAVANR